MENAQEPTGGFLVVAAGALLAVAALAGVVWLATAVLM